LFLFKKVFLTQNKQGGLFFFKKKRVLLNPAYDTRSPLVQHHIQRNTWAWRLECCTVSRHDMLAGAQPEIL